MTVDCTPWEFVGVARLTLDFFGVRDVSETVALMNRLLILNFMKFICENSLLLRNGTKFRGMCIVF